MKSSINIEMQGSTMPERRQAAIFVSKGKPAFPLGEIPQLLTQDHLDFLLTSTQLKLPLT